MIIWKGGEGASGDGSLMLTKKGPYFITFEDVDYLKSSPFEVKKRWHQP